jgi:hypothetical protein
MTLAGDDDEPSAEERAEVDRALQPLCIALDQATAIALLLGITREDFSDFAIRSYDYWDGVRQHFAEEEDDAGEH